jgi:hypothetical protein
MLMFNLQITAEATTPTPEAPQPQAQSNEEETTEESSPSLQYECGVEGAANMPKKDHALSLFLLLYCFGSGSGFTRVER